MVAMGHMKMSEHIETKQLVGTLLVVNDRAPVKLTQEMVNYRVMKFEMMETH